MKLINLIKFLLKILITFSITTTTATTNDANKFKIRILNKKSANNENFELLSISTYQNEDNKMNIETLTKLLSNHLLLEIQRKTKNCMKNRKLCLLYAIKRTK
jgi:hypothetical protein